MKLAQPINMLGGKTALQGRSLLRMPEAEVDWDLVDRAFV